MRVTIFLAILTLFVFSECTVEQVCKCPAEYKLICDKNYLLILKQPCTTSCVELTTPVNSDPQEENTCREKEEIMSVTRPVRVVATKYHNCMCVKKKGIAPVCTTELITYINECTAKCLRPSSKVLAAGECVVVKSDQSCGSCYKYSSPVCASNGQSFTNECMFNCFKKENNASDLMIRHNGRCNDENDSPFIERKNDDTDKKKSDLVPRIGKPRYDNEETENVISNLLDDFEKELLEHVDFSHKRIVRKKGISPRSWRTKRRADRMKSFNFTSLTQRRKLGDSNTGSYHCN